MTNTIKRYIKFIRGMSLVETLFASAVLSVVVVSGLTVTSDAIKSRTKGEARVAMMTEGVSTVEKARHEKDANPDARTLLRERLKDGGDYRTLEAKVENDEVTAAATFDALGDNQKLLLRSAFAGKNEALSTFFSTNFECDPFSHPPTNSSSSSKSKSGSGSSSSSSSSSKSGSSSKSKSGSSSKSCGSKSKSKSSCESSPDAWDAHVAVTVYDYPNDNRDAFTIDIPSCTKTSNDGPSFDESGQAARVYTCSREDITASSWQPTITVNGFFSNANHQPGICVAEDQADKPSWVTTSCTLDSSTNAASISLVLRNNERACATGDVPENSEFPSTSSGSSSSSKSSKSSTSSSGSSSSSSSS